MKRAILALLLPACAMAQPAQSVVYSPSNGWVKWTNTNALRLPTNTIFASPANVRTNLDFTNQVIAAGNAYGWVTNAGSSDWDTLSNKPTWIGETEGTTLTNLGLGVDNLPDFTGIKSVQHTGHALNFEEQRLTNNAGIVIQWDETNAVIFGNPQGTKDGLGLGASWLTNSNPPVTTNASELTSGTLDDARLSTNVATYPLNTDFGPDATVTAGTLYARAPDGAPGEVPDGRLRLSPAQGTAYYTDIVPGYDSSTNRTLTLPHADGQLALTTLANVGTNAPAARTNLNLVLSALTNSNVANFLSAIFTNALAAGFTWQTDGAGGAGFVASRVQSVRLSTNFPILTNNLASTNTAVTNLAVSVDANSTYRLAYSLFITCTSAGGTGAQAALVSSQGTNGWVQQGVGRANRPNNTFQDTQVAAVTAGQAIMLLHNTTGFGADATNAPFTGFGIFTTGSSNSTLTVRFAQLTTTTNVSTLHSNSVLQVEKLSP